MGVNYSPASQERKSAEFFKIIAGQHDCALSMKPKSFMKGMISETYAVPKDKLELKRIIKKRNYVIRGGATTFSGGTMPHANETTISSLNFDTLKISKSGIATVGAGVPYFQLINKAKENGFEVPCYPVSTNGSTVGGFISNAGTVGMNSRGTGYLYDYIEEMEVVTPSGDVYKVRNNDIIDFFGAEGNLGMITQVKMRLLPQETRYIHMYGFDGIEDVIKFLETDDNIYIAYFMNEIALKRFQKDWQIKFLHKFNLIVIDKNWRDDYTKEMRGDLASRGISYIYPKDILKWCFKKIGTLELNVAKNKTAVHIGDGVIKIDEIGKITRIAKSNKLPLFCNVGKEEILFRIYGNCKTKLKQNKFFGIMDKIFSYAQPYTVGSLYRSYLKGTKREKMFKDAEERYDDKKKNPPRLELYPNNFAGKLGRKLSSILAGKLW